MSVTEWAAGEVFTARIYKTLAGRQDLLWANTYELFVVDMLTDAEAGAAAVVRALAHFESQFHLPGVLFDRGVFSTHVEDGQPYKPDSFVSVSLQGIEGGRPLGAVNALPLNYCLFVRRQVGFGRTGRLLYRRVLHEGDVESPSGDPVLTTGVAGTLQALIDGPYLGDGTSPDIVTHLRQEWGLDFVMVGSGTPTGNVRQVESFEVAGARIKDYNNAHYNRSTPPILGG